VRGVDHRGATAFAERLRQTVSRIEIATGETSIRVTVSAGVASLGECKTSDELLMLSDERLYRAKEAGRNSVCA
jgi:diguanylate cyclase (GGDEF)-like protein